MKYLEYTYNEPDTGKELDLGAVPASPDNLIALLTEMPEGQEMRIREVESD